MELKKVILFLWFGDEKPKYIEWTLENFRKMNPGWEILYIEYTTDQVIHHELVKDPILTDVMKSRDKFGYIGNVSNDYRRLYLNRHTEMTVYCDLDCFPIAPFDNFIFPENMELKSWQKWMKNNHPCEHTHHKLMGCNWFRNEKCQEFIPDVWCMVNNKSFLNWHFLQLHKGSTIDDTLVIHGGMFMNECAIPEYEERNKKFHEMKLELGDCFCLPKYSPIEHYYSLERNRLNKQCKGKI